MRKFNVYSPLIVVVPNETFEWVLNSAEGNSVSIAPSGGSWPLTPSNPTVNAGTPVQVTVASGANPGSYTFTCTPPAPNVTTQQLIVAALEFVDPCSDINVMAGEYFVWKNATNGAVTIVPDPGNPNFWPIGDQHHVIEANGHHAVQIPANAKPNPYNLLVTYDGGGGCDQDTQPKLIVGGSGMAGS